MEPVNCLGTTGQNVGGNPTWTSIPSSGSRNTPSRFILQKPEISAGTDEPSGRTISIGADFTLLVFNKAPMIALLSYQLAIKKKSSSQGEN